MSRKSATDTPGNGAQLAKLLNLTLPQCYNLANSGTIPSPDNGVWDLAACAHAYIKYLQGRAGEEKRDYAVERTRLTKAQADKTELEIATMKGQLYPAPLVQTVWNGMIASFRARMLAIPAKAAPICAGMPVALLEDELRESIYEVLSELADYEPERYLPTSPGVATDHRAAAETDREPVGEPGAPSVQRKRSRTRTVPNHPRPVPTGDDGRGE